MHDWKRVLNVTETAVNHGELTPNICLNIKGGPENPYPGRRGEPWSVLHNSAVLCAPAGPAEGG